MIFVLSGSRRETARWAESQGIPLRQARHVYDAQTLPGRIAGVRFVQLPGFATRRDRHAIVNRLKRTNYRKIPVEIWLQRDDEVGDWYQDLGEPVPEPAEMPRNDMVLKALEMGAEFDLGEDEPQDETPTAVEDGEPEAPAADEDNEADPDPLEQFLGLEEKQPEPEEDDVKAHEVVEVVQPVEAEAIEESKPKRTRRTKVQMAYDAALADWENNGGSLEAVIEARDALAAKHPEDERLLTAPQSDDEVEAQAEDDDALDF